MKKIETAITSTPRNEGMHSARNYQKCKKMIVENDYSKARLYHLVFTRIKDAPISPSEANFQYAIKALAEKLRDNKVPCDWKSAFEYEDEDGGLHMHVWLLVDAGAGGNPEHWLSYDTDRDSWLTATLKAKHIKFHVAPPKGAMHRTRLGKRYRYIYVPKEGPKLEDALLRCSYIYKKRGKDGLVGRVKNIYGSSRERKKTQPERNYEAITEKAANSSIESIAPNQELGQPGHYMEASPQHSMETTSASSQTKAGNASSECSRSPGRADTHYQPIEAVSRESSFPLDRPIGEGSIRQMIRKGSILVRNEPPLKLMSGLAQNIVDNGYDPAHNSPTMFRSAQEAA